MYNKILCVYLLGFILVFCVRIAECTEKGVLEGSSISVSADIAVNSKYIWRGFALDDDPVMQQGVYVSAYGVTGSIWGSFDIDADDNLSSDEFDWTMNYTYEKNKISLSLGHTYYGFPASNAESKEFYIAAELDIPSSPILTWYHDYGKESSGGGDGDYWELGISHSVPFNKNSITFDLIGNVGYNHKLFINGDGLDVSIGAGLNISLTDKMFFNPSISYSVPFADLEDSNDGNQDSKFFGGFKTLFNF